MITSRPSDLLGQKGAVAPRMPIVPREKSSGELADWSKNLRLATNPGYIAGAEQWIANGRKRFVKGGGRCDWLGFLWCLQ